MNNLYVLDACAMIAFLRAEVGAHAVAALFDVPENVFKAHAVNLCEVYYDSLKRADATRAGALIRRLREIGVAEVTDCDETIWQVVARFKAQFRRISLADCFALALAVSRDATLVTSDHHEFDPVAAAGIAKIQFIR